MRPTVTARPSAFNRFTACVAPRAFTSTWGKRGRERVPVSVVVAHDVEKQVARQCQQPPEKWPVERDRVFGRLRRGQAEPVGHIALTDQLPQRGGLRLKTIEKPVEMIGELAIGWQARRQQLQRCATDGT